ncbi:MAG: histidine kinase [Hyphomicrobiales bacterium]|nr:histidine kinase [Hyphomicrobiales bacterium]
MWAYLKDLLDSDSLSPHGICLLWRPELIWTHVVSDFLIGASYFSIPVFLGYLVWKRPDISFNWVIWCFAVFILACGTTHFFSIWTLWAADYGVEAIIKVVTAAASIATAVLLWPLLPKALSWPSPTQLAAANGELIALVAERDAALAALRREAGERARAEEMLRQAQKMEALGQLTGGVAHDFNNLLTVISMNLDRIERASPAAVEGVLARSVHHARSAAEKAGSITARMLAFARKEPINPKPFDVRTAVRDIEPFLRDVVRGQNNLVLDFSEAPCPAFADPHQFDNAVLNLAINARDALAEGGEVRISVAPDAGFVRIEVCDDGVGMNEDVRARAFEPFFTTKSVGKGSGLGLSQVFGFVQQSHGEIAIESTVGKGTRVIMRLPQMERTA